ncbi:MAG: resolvase [Armatimonadota bacterium]
MITVLAVDPGRSKCGIAVVSSADGILHRAVIATNDLPGAVTSLITRFSPEVMVIGSGTGSQEAISSLGDLEVPVRVVNERHSTEEARARYFKDNPPRGWRKYVPIGLQTPPQPYDDYAAVVLAEEYLERTE